MEPRRTYFVISGELSTSKLNSISINALNKQTHFWKYFVISCRMDQVSVKAKYIQSINNSVDSDHATSLHRIITGLCRHLYLMNAAPNRAEVRREISVGWYVFFISKLAKKFSPFSFSGSARSFGRGHHIADKECEIPSETDKSVVELETLRKSLFLMKKQMQDVLQ